MERDIFGFLVFGSGKCCTGASGFIFITKDDVLNISKKLEMEPEKFMKKYARWVPNLKKWSLIEKSLGEDFHCFFLSNGKTCDIYDVRPTQCKTYPYWPGVMKSEESWRDESIGCEGMRVPEAPLNSVEKILSTLKEQEEDNEKALSLGRRPKFDKKEEL